MISVLQTSANAKPVGHLDLAPNPPKGHVNARHLMHSPQLTARSVLTDIFSIVHRSTATASVSSKLADDLSSYLSCSHPTFHFGRVATMGCHDSSAWTEAQKVHDTKPNAVAAPSSLGSNGATLNDCSPLGVARENFASMEFRTQGLWTVEQLVNATRFREEVAARPHEWTSLVTPSSGIPPVRLNVTVGPYSHEDLSEGRRRVGEILVRCGVINVSGMSPIESTVIGCGDTSGAHPIGTSVPSSMLAELPSGEDGGPLITALASWTSEWVHTLVIQPYLLGNFRFRYQVEPSQESTSIALRIHRVLSRVHNPVQVAIHALWFIGVLTGNGAHNKASRAPPFLSIPIFRYLHNNGTFIAEDFMFRAFITCAMIGDKTVNDTTLSTNTWSRLTRIPQVILNATEKYILKCLKWNAVMTRIQWQDTLIYLRSCIKMGSTFDPFAYDEISPSGTMARCLDELINFSYADNTYTPQQEALAVEIVAPQPIKHLARWGIFDTAEWCPNDDPVINRRPKIIGIAPGSDQNSSTLTIEMTARDLLESILASSNIPELAHLARPGTGTSFCGSFGVIGPRLAHTVKITTACQNTPWFPSHG